MKNLNEKKESLISVVISTYNRKALVRRAVQSVLNQTYSNFEIIIVDDGSTDDTEIFLEDIIKSDSRIKYFRTKNNGACAARNYGMKKSRGEIIALLDSDDEFLPNKLECQLEKMEQVDAKFTVSNREISVNGKVSKETEEQSYWVEDYRKVSDKMPLSASLLMFKRKISEEFSFDENLPSGNDLDFVLRVMTKYKVYFIGEVLNVIYKSFAYDRISTNYKKKIRGYKSLLEKYENGVYPDIEYNKFFTNKITFNLALFHLLNEDYFESKEIIKNLLKMKDLTLNYRIKGLIVLIFSQLPFLFKGILVVLKFLWSKGFKFLR